MTQEAAAQGRDIGQTRADALAQLKRAQVMLYEGKDQLRLGQQKIDEAQRLIDNSAEVLRSTWDERIR